MWITNFTTRIKLTAAVVLSSVLIFTNSSPVPEITGNNAEEEDSSEPDNSDLHIRLNAKTESVIKIWAFGYGKANGPNIWHENFRDCGGVHQSPINLDTVSSVTVHHPHLFWWNYNLKPDKMVATNNGHTMVVRGKWSTPADVPYYWHSTGKQSEENYVFEQLHFHWGSKDTIGSEHTINGQRFPLEMHVVHYKRRFSNITQALSAAEGLRVVALLFMLSDTENVAMRPVISALQHIREPLTSVEIEPFELSRILPQFSNFFMTYNGSLTAPPCAETVSWVVRLEPSTISKEQLEEFRKLLGGHEEPLANNYRPIQPLNGRNVWHVR